MYTLMMLASQVYLMMHCYYFTGYKYLLDPYQVLSYQRRGHTTHATRCTRHDRP